MNNVCVIGAGYVGLVSAACFAELGNNVTVLEIDPEKLELLARGAMPISEPGLLELWERNHTLGRLRVVNNYSEGLRGAKFAFIAVGTPSARNGSPDLRWVQQAAKSIATEADGPLTVVLKSTVPVGTADMVAEILDSSSRSGNKFSVVSNPEFLREGVAVFDFMHPTRIVVGASDKHAAEALIELYAPLASTVITCDCRAAELSKYVSNVFLATRISFINEIASLCDAYGVDTAKVAKVTELEPRCGKGYLGAGLGWGGSCLPKDVRGLIHMAKSRGVPLSMVEAVLQINDCQPRIAIGKLRRLVGNLEGKTVGVLGLSFKSDSDDMREASSLSVISLLLRSGCSVRAYDPIAMEKASKLLPKVTLCRDAYEVATGSDGLILVTDWREFKELDMKRLSSLMNIPILIDGRNIYDPKEMAEAGFVYEGMGRQGKHRMKTEKALGGIR